MNKKIFYYFVTLVVAVFLVSCAGLQETAANATKKESTGEKPVLVKLNQSDIKRVTDPSQIASIRFHFEKELVLTLVDEPGNGILQVNEDGNFVLLNDKIIRFPVSKLAKFSNPNNVSNGNSSFQITWEEESYDPELGTSSLSAEYDDSLRVVIMPDGLAGGKPYVVYQKAKYSLPQDYKQYFFVLSKLEKGKGKVVSGVKTPGQEAGGN